MSELAPLVELATGVFYLTTTRSYDQRCLRFMAGSRAPRRKAHRTSVGRGLVAGLV